MIYLDRKNMMEQKEIPSINSVLKLPARNSSCRYIVKALELEVSLQRNKLELNLS